MSETHPNPYPLGWRDWPREARIEYLLLSRSRSGLVLDLLSFAGYEKDPMELGPGDARLNQDELAAIYDAVFDAISQK